MVRKVVGWVLLVGVLFVVLSFFAGFDLFSVGSVGTDVVPVGVVAVTPEVVDGRLGDFYGGVVPGRSFGLIRGFYVIDGAECSVYPDFSGSFVASETFKCFENDGGNPGVYESFTFELFGSEEGFIGRRDVRVGGFGCLPTKVGQLYWFDLYYCNSDGVERSCLESDDGLDKYEKGTLYITIGDDSDSFSDYCASGSKLIERYCCGNDDTSTCSDTVICAYGCLDGACLRASSATVDCYYCDGEDLRVKTLDGSVCSGIYSKTALNCLEPDDPVVGVDCYLCDGGVVKKTFFSDVDECFSPYVLIPPQDCSGGDGDSGVSVTCQFCEDGSFVEFVFWDETGFGHCPDGSWVFDSVDAPVSCRNGCVGEDCDGGFDVRWYVFVGLAGLLVVLLVGLGLFGGKHKGGRK